MGAADVAGWARQALSSVVRSPFEGLRGIAAHGLLPAVLAAPGAATASPWTGMRRRGGRTRDERDVYAANGRCLPRSSGVSVAGVFSGGVRGAAAQRDEEFGVFLHDEVPGTGDVWTLASLPRSTLAEMPEG